MMIKAESEVEAVPGRMPRSSRKEAAIEDEMLDFEIRLQVF